MAAQNSLKNYCLYCSFMKYTYFGKRSVDNYHFLKTIPNKIAKLKLRT